MERSFIATNESEFVQDYEKYILRLSEQKEFIKKYFKEKGIESPVYYIGGDGIVNIPFGDYEKSSITLKIEPTENDITRFGLSLSKPNEQNLCAFRKNSKIGKEFAQRCIDEKIIFNLYYPRVGDYFQKLSYMGCGWETFKHNNNFYIKIQSDYLKADDTPKGFIEIKLSEFYKAKEEYENKEGE